MIGFNSAFFSSADYNGRNLRVQGNPMQNKHELEFKI